MVDGDNDKLFSSMYFMYFQNHWQIQTRLKILEG